MTPRTLLPLFAAASLLGCATLDEPSVAPAPVPGGAWLVLERPATSLQYLLRSARVRLDDGPRLALSAGERRRLPLPAGRHALTVDLWDAPGRCRIEFDLAVGQTRRVTVMPRVASVLPALPLLALHPATPLQVAAGGAAMLAGMAAESAGQDCAGAFEAVVVAD